MQQKIFNMSLLIIHSIVASQKIITTTLSQTIIKNPTFGSQFPNPSANVANSQKGRLFAVLVLGLVILY